MREKSVKKSVLLAVSALVAVIIVSAAVAWGLTRDEGESSARGVCGSGAWELALEKDDGATELDFELQSSVPGEAWEIEVEQGDELLLDSERTTDEDAELDLDVVARDGGFDSFRVTATPTDGEACIATLTR